MEILEFAIQMEKDGHQYYHELASKTTHPGIKGVLEKLAAEELEHQHAIEKVQKGSASIAESKVLDKAKNVFQQMKDFGEEFDLSGDEESLYSQAMDLEQKSVSFYLDRAEQMENAKQKVLFEKLAEEEKKHYHLMSNLVDFVASPKTWLETARFSRLDEY